MVSTRECSVVLFNLINYLVTGYSEPDTTKYLDNYHGENFPPKYLVPEDFTPTTDDIYFYVQNLELLTGYCLKSPNKTDVNQGLSFFFVKGVLKKSLQDYGHKINGTLPEKIKNLIHEAEYIESHYVHMNKPYGLKDIEFRVSQLFANDESLIYSIENFTRYRLIPWLLSKSNMHTFNRHMDSLELPKERYAEISHGLEGYAMTIQESDTCLSRIIHNPVPVGMDEWRPCDTSKHCRRAMFKTPSVGYLLSHRMLNVLLYRSKLRCYIESPARDMVELEQMCAFMYREAVYIARRGFFARDIFLEHLALCSLLGYEEFYRRSWYYAVSKWIDEDGCITEFPNFALNHTKMLRDKIKDPIKARKMYIINKKNMLEECHTHPMALLKIVLAHAIRHALYLLPVLR